MQSKMVVCPKCGKSDKIQKVSGVYSAGTWIGHQTDLAARLSPPAKPAPRAFLGGHLGWIAVGVVLLVGLFVVLSAVGGDVVFGMCFSPVFTGIAFSVAQAWHSRNENLRVLSEILAWGKDMELWQRLYYCARDDGVFDPEEGRFQVIEQLPWRGTKTTDSV